MSSEENVLEKYYPHAHANTSIISYESEPIVDLIMDDRGIGGGNICQCISFQHILITF